MNVLLLGQPRFDYCKIGLKIIEQDNFLFETKQINLDYVKKHKVDWIITYNYKYTLFKDVLESITNSINFHLSFLPYNRGYYPNLWGFIDETPQGVTIHEIDEEINTGDILIQEEVIFHNRFITLYETWAYLQKTIETLFCKNWNKIKTGNIEKKKQNPYLGSYHTKEDLPELPKGWYTKINEIL